MKEINTQQEQDTIEIWKLQIPIVCNGIPECLVYNEDRSKIGPIPLTQEIRGLFPEDVFKIYVEGIMDSRGVIDMHDVVEDQDW